MPPLSHLRKIPSPTSGSNKGVKIVPKALSGAIGQHFGKKFGLLPTAGAREKPRNLLQSDEQCPGAPLSHLRKIPSATSGSNKGVKIVPKALSGAIARHSGDGKFYAMPHNEALVGG